MDVSAAGKVTDVRAPQPRNAELSIAVTDAGNAMEVRPESLNA
eukprot:SAG31_NODE_22503_length_524_cov_0.931765_1_plen_42_part_10